MLPRHWIVFPLIGLAIGLLFAAQRVQTRNDEPLEPLGLPGVREYNALVVDDRDPKVMLLGTERGVFRTRDGGVHWVLSGLDGRDVQAIARRGAAYVAGNERFAARSVDRGVTWNLAKVAAPYHTDVVVDPNDERRRLAFYHGLRSTTDGGQAWRDAGIDAATAAWSPSEPGVAYAIATDGQLYRTGDAGRTWDVAG